jgi:hypothetical protein
MNRNIMKTAPQGIWTALIAFGITAIVPIIYPAPARSAIALTVDELQPGDHLEPLDQLDHSNPAQNAYMRIDESERIDWRNNSMNFDLISNNPNDLADGEHIFSSRSPDPNQHPDVHLAGAEIFALLKQGNQVIGEHFIANSGNTACFRGKISGKVILGEEIVTGYMETPRRQDLSPVQFDLSGLILLSRQDNAYAQGSVQRCQQVFRQLDR